MSASLRSKRFRSVSEQRKTEEWDSQFDSCSSFFVPKPHRNACYVGYVSAEAPGFNERHKTIFTLRRLLTNVKGKDKPEDRPGAVYKIHCSDCKATYIGETGRNLTTRLTEHKRATKKGDLNNNIAEHHLKTSHAID